MALAKQSAWFVILAALMCGVGQARADDVGESIHITLLGRLQNRYFFRGLLQNAQGTIMQGAAEMRVTLSDSRTFAFKTLGGFWLSLHPGDQREGGNVPAAWYESRMYGGAELSAGGLDVNLLFLAYSSPNGSFDDVYELGLNARFRDDTRWAGSDEDAHFRGFFPELNLAHELSGARDGGASGTYAQLSIAPRLRALYGALLVIEFALPVSVGMSLGDYYETARGPAGRRRDHFLGYASAGLLLDIAERWVPERWGRWNLQPSFVFVFPSAMNAAHGACTDTMEYVAGIDTVWSF